MGEDRTIFSLAAFRYQNLVTFYVKLYNHPLLRSLLWRRVRDEAGEVI
jgi:hypothetical protein